MPQLLPFSFISSVTWLILLLGAILWGLSVLILPLFPRAQIARMYIVLL